MNAWKVPHTDQDNLIHVLLDVKKVKLHVMRTMVGISPQLLYVADRMWLERIPYLVVVNALGLVPPLLASPRLSVTSY